MSDSLLVEKKDGVTWATLNRPKELNSINFEILTGLQAAVKDVNEDPKARALVIKANGRAFCTGADLKFVAASSGSAREIERFIRTFQELFLAMEQCGRPIIAAVQGIALAGGLELVMACDLAIASDEAKLADQHINFAILPGGGGTQRLPRIVGLRRALELLMTGDWISAAEAERLGLVNKVVPAAKLEQAVTELVDKLKAKSPVAIKAMKRLARGGMQVDLQSALEMEVQASLLHRHSKDLAEGLAAFNEKRPPVFTGE